MEEIEFAENQSYVGPDEKRIRVVGNSFFEPDGTKVTYVEYAVIPNDSLFFVDGKWYARKEQVSEAITLGMRPTVKIDWSSVKMPQQDIDVSYTVETDLLALTDES